MTRTNRECITFCNNGVGCTMVFVFKKLAAVGKKRCDARGIRTPNLEVWNLTRYHCAMASERWLRGATWPARRRITATIAVKTYPRRDSNPNLILGRDKYYPCTMDAQHLPRVGSGVVGSLFRLVDLKKEDQTTSAGFEPTRAEPIRFRV